MKSLAITISAILVMILSVYVFNTLSDFYAGRSIAYEVEESRAGLKEISASDYTTLENLASVNRLEVFDITHFSDGHLGEQYLVGSNDNVMLSFSSAETGRQTVIMDKDANIILKASTSDGLYPMGDYLVSLSGYYSILLDGNADFKPYETYVSENPVTEETIQKIYKESLYYLSDNYGVSDENDRYLYRMYVHHFFHQGRWIEIKIDFQLEKYLNWKHAENAPALGIESLTHKFPQIKPDANPNASYFNDRVSISLDYFRKEKFHPATSAKFMSPTGGSRPAYWTGDGYYSLEFDGQEIKFIAPYYYHGQFSLHGHSTLNFIILQHDKRGKSHNTLIRLMPEIAN